MTKRKRPDETGLNSETSTLIIADTTDLSRYLLPLRGKIPAVTGTWKRSFDDGEFPAGCNFGLRLGEEAEWGYLTVIDYDGPEHFLDFLSMLQEKGIEIDTVAVKTGGKHNGYHLYYWTDEAFTGRFKGQFEGVDVEILGKGTYTVIPPSTVLTDYRLVKAFTERDPITHRVSSVSDFLTEIEGASQISEAKINVIKERLSQNVPTNLYISSLVRSEGYALISSDLLLWETVLNGAFEELYNERLHLSNSHRFRCIFHKEKRPSAGLHIVKGRYVYHDFHTGKSLDLVEVFHAIKNHQDPRFLEAKNSRKWLDGLLELFEWIDENRITTGFGERFDRWRDDFLARLSLTGGGEFKSYIVDTLKTILEISRERINKGINELVLSKRFVADRVPWEGSDQLKAKIVNRAMNFLVFTGILKKGRNLSTENGRTYIFSIDFDCTTEAIERAWSKAVNANIATYDKFNKSNVADVFGPDVANMIFRALAIERGMENEEIRTEATLQRGTEVKRRDGQNIGIWPDHRVRCDNPIGSHRELIKCSSSIGRVGDRARFEGGNSKHVQIRR